VQVRQKGSHVILKKQVRMKDGEETQVSEIGCVVPLHRKAIAVGTLSNTALSISMEYSEILKTFAYQGI